MLVNLNDVLKDAKDHHYAVGLFNTTDTDMLDAAISAAEEMRSPIIVGTAEVLLPYGELKLISPALVAAAQRAAVPVVIHYDHGLTFERCIEALKLGFSSVMYDGSAKETDENYKETHEIVRIAHAMGATVEGEIGHVGDVMPNGEAEANPYTTVREAIDFVNNTGVDALAIAIGTAHGAYKQKPKLDFDRLKEIRAALDTPLVLHGGSGLADSDFKNAIKYGIAKINIYTDMCLAANKAVETALKSGLSYNDVRNAKVDAIKQVVMNKIQLFNSQNKA